MFAADIYGGNALDVPVAVSITRRARGSCTGEIPYSYNANLAAAAAFAANNGECEGSETSM